MLHFIRSTRFFDMALLQAGRKQRAAQTKIRFAAEQTLAVCQRKFATGGPLEPLLWPGELMKNLLAVALVAASLLATGIAFAATGLMLHGVSGGDGWTRSDGGAGVSLLFTVVVFGLAIWVLSQWADERSFDAEQDQ
jgi:hypothetical protein